MLGALVAACGCAILFIVLPTNSFLSSRFIGSSVMIAFACAAALPALSKGGSGKPSPLEISWLGLLAVEVSLGLLLVWENGAMWGWREEVVIAAMFLLFGGYAIAFIPLQQLGKTHGPSHRLCGIAVGAIALATVAVIAALSINSATGGTNWLLIPTWWVLMAWIVAAGTSAMGFAPPRSFGRRLVSTIGIAAATIAGSVTIAVIHSDANEHNLVVLTTGSICAGLAGCAAVLSVIDVLVLGKTERHCALAFAAMLATTGLLGAWITASGNQADERSWSVRLFMASLVADGCLGLATVILYKVGRRNQLREWDVDGTEVRCPRCNKRSFFKIGTNPCAHCGIRVLVAFQDEKCPRCQHDLRNLTSDHPCPECGLMPERSAARYSLPEG